MERYSEEHEIIKKCFLKSKKKFVVTAALRHESEKFWTVLITNEMNAWIK